MTPYTQSMAEMADRRSRIEILQQELRDLQAAVSPEPVADYGLTGADGPVRLSQLFGDKEDLVVIHNMGTSCAYCTLWADGFNGVYDHLNNRAAFVVTSPDAPKTQAQFAVGRGWKFPMVSHAGSGFAEDMGYKSERGWQPGISVFKRDGDQVLRVSDRPLGPGDPFCSVFHVFDLLAGGLDGWQAKFRYGEAPEPRGDTGDVAS